MTFSIAVRCSQTGVFGAAIASASPCIGTFCLWLHHEHGACCTQAWTNPRLGASALQNLQAGADASAAVANAIAEDEDAGQRQLGVVGKAGEGAAWTGDLCTPVHGHRCGPGYSIQGNMLASCEVLDAMEEAYIESRELQFTQKLLGVLQAGQAAGGDKRGQQSAAIALIGPYPWCHLDLRVDDHRTPLTELQRLYDIAVDQFLPFALSVPDDNGSSPGYSDAVREMMLIAPEQRQSLKDAEKKKAKS